MSNMMIATPRIILFDWDNTLVASWQSLHDALQVTLEAMGHQPWTLDETKARARLSIRDNFPRLFGDEWERARAIYLAAFEAIHLERLEILLGAADCLRALVDQGKKLAVVSNKTGRLLRREVEAAGWGGLFDSVVGAGDARADKPDSAPVELALETHPTVARSDVWFVGDAGVDLKCAVNAACVPVLLVGPDAGVLHENEDELPRPALRLTSFAALRLAAQGSPY